MNPAHTQDDNILANFGLHEIQKSLAISVEYVCGCGVEGDVAEFGTNTGRTAMILATALRFFGDWRKHNCGMNCQSPKRLLLFDSFKGLPKITEESDRRMPHIEAGVWGEGYFWSVNKDELSQRVAQHLAPADFSIYDGWFSDTLPNLPDSTRFSCLHLDCDLYQSTKDVLENVLSRGLVSPGAVLLFDDWNSNRADPQFGQRRLWPELVERFAIRYSDWGPYGFGSHRFIVHDYRPELAIAHT